MAKPLLWLFLGREAELGGNREGILNLTPLTDLLFDFFKLQACTKNKYFP